MNISDLVNSATTARTLGNIVLVTPASKKGYTPVPKNLNNGAQEPEIPALVFNYEAENSVQLESDITDHYVEDNTAIQDQIALRPDTYTVNGFIGELNNVVPDFLQPLKLSAEKLTVLSAYSPSLTATALIDYNRAKFLYDTGSSLINDAVNTWDLINARFLNGTEPQNKQQQMFTKLYGYFTQRYLFNVQTPWMEFKNMAIKSLRAIQDPETNLITDFQITFKKINFAQTNDVTQNLTYDASNFQGRAFNQGAAEIPFGSQVGEESTQPASDLWRTA